MAFGRVARCDLLKNLISRARHAKSGYQIHVDLNRKPPSVRWGLNVKQKGLPDLDIDDG
jgi:hypothetical protein